MLLLKTAPACDTLGLRTSIATYCSPLTILGDFNIRVDNVKDSDTATLLDILANHSLRQRNNTLPETHYGSNNHTRQSSHTRAANQCTMVN